VHVDNVERRRVRQQLRRVVEVDAELAAVSRLHLGVRVGRHPHVDAQGDLGVHAERQRGLGDAIELAARVDDDRPDAGGERLLELCARLGDAVEHDAVRLEAGPQRLPQLAARVDLGAEPRAPHPVEHPERAAGLAREEDLTLRVARDESLPHRLAVLLETPAAVEEEGRRQAPSESVQVDAVEAQVTVVDGEAGLVTKHWDLRGRRGRPSIVRPAGSRDRDLAARPYSAATSPGRWSCATRSSSVSARRTSSTRPSASTA
jgi:hypothetical protein